MAKLVTTSLHKVNIIIFKYMKFTIDSTTFISFVNYCMTLYFLYFAFTINTSSLKKYLVWKCHYCPELHDFFIPHSIQLETCKPVNKAKL